MANAVYLLCAFMSFTCSIMLFRGYSKNQFRLLFWTGLGFLGFAFNNILLFVDLIIIPHGMDLSVVRTLPSLLGMSLMVYGLISDAV